MTKEQKEGFARASLEGVSIGDAFGEQFFTYPHLSGRTVTNAVELVTERRMPPAPWYYTDDTEMALSLYATLRQFGHVDQDYLAQSFAKRYDPHRGYGPAMHGLLQDLRLGASWRTEARDLFNGLGSWGNGALMRVAPLGAYFASDPEQVVEQARLSAEVTHTHPEASAGAIAIAVAAAQAVRLRGTTPLPRGADFLDRVLPSVPESIVRTRLQEARDLTDDSVLNAVRVLGNGSQISAMDTAPYCLWCAAASLDNYEEALWRTVFGLGDIDTNCAIVGGIVAAFVGEEGIPAEWRSAREPLPAWPFEGAP